MLNWLSKEFLLAIIATLAIALIAVSWGGPPSQYIHPPAGQGAENSQGNQATADQTKILQIECDPNCTAMNSDKIRNSSLLVRVTNKIIDDPITSGILIANFLLVIGVISQVRDARRASERQLRAYVSVSFLGMVPQDSTTNYHFEPRMTLINTGDTPAYDVQCITRANVLPVPLPDDFVLELVTNPATASAGVLGPRQNYIVNAAVDRLLTADEITEVSTVGTRQIYMWGKVTYRDAFGVGRYTHFCQRVVWLKGGQFMGFNTRRHNDAD